MALVTKNSVRRTGVRQASRMPTSPGYFFCLHQLLSLLVTFFLSDQALHRAGDTVIDTSGLTSVKERSCLHIQPKSKNPREGL